MKTISTTIIGQLLCFLVTVYNQNYCVVYAETLRSARKPEQNEQERNLSDASAEKKWGKMFFKLISKGCDTTMSSSWNGYINGLNYEAKSSYAVDGNFFLEPGLTQDSPNQIPGELRYFNSALSSLPATNPQTPIRIAHSWAETDPWLEVNLGGNYFITDVLVVNRLDCCKERLDGATVSLTPGWSDPDRNTIDIPLYIGGDRAYGRADFYDSFDDYPKNLPVASRVTLKIPGDNKVLQIQQILVFGFPVETYIAMKLEHVEQMLETLANP